MKYKTVDIQFIANLPGFCGPHLGQTVKAYM